MFKPKQIVHILHNLTCSQTFNLLKNHNIVQIFYLHTELTILIASVCCIL